MCLGIPGQVVEIYDINGTLMSKVDFGGITQEVCVATVPDVAVGQFVLVHAGFALNIMSDEEAAETLKLLEELENFNRDHTAAEQSG